MTPTHHQDYCINKSFLGVQGAILQKSPLAAGGTK